MGSAGMIWLSKAAQILGADREALRRLAQEGKIPGAVLLTRTDNPKSPKVWYVPESWMATVRVEGKPPAEEEVRMAPVNPQPDYQEDPQEEIGQPLEGQAEAQEQEPEPEQPPAAPPAPAPVPPAPINVNIGGGQPPAAVVPPAAPKRGRPAKNQPAAQPAVRRELSPAERGVASLRATHSGAIREVKIFREDQVTGDRVYKGSVSTFPPDPFALLQQRCPEGGRFYFQYYDMTQRQMTEDGPYTIDPVVGLPPAAPDGQVPQGGMMDQVVGRLADAALQGADKQGAILEAAERGVERGVSFTQPVIDQLRVIEESQRMKASHELEMMRERAKEDRDRDREYFAAMAKDREDLAKERQADRESFYKSLMDAEKARQSEHKEHLEKMYALQKEQLESHKAALETGLKMQEKMLDMGKQHWEEIRAIKESQRPIEALLKLAGQAMEKFGDRFDTILAANPAVAGRLAGGPQAPRMLPAPPPAQQQTQAAAPAATAAPPAPGTNGGKPEERPLSPEEAMKILANTSDDDMLKAVKNDAGVYPEIVDGIGMCLYFNRSPDFFFGKLVEKIAGNVEMPFVLRALSRVQNPMDFFQPPHVQVPQNSIDLIMKNPQWVASLQAEIQKWVAANPQLFSAPLGIAGQNRA